MSRRTAKSRRYRRNPVGRVLRAPSQLQQLTGEPGRLKRGDIVAYDGGEYLGRVTGASGQHVEIETVGGTLRELKDAMRRYEAFRKVPVDSIDVGPKPPELGVVFRVGRLLDIAYEIESGPRKGRYRHQFRAKSQPDLVVNSDGKSLLIYGDRFEFTAHGIEDR